MDDNPGHVPRPDVRRERAQTSQSSSAAGESSSRTDSPHQATDEAATGSATSASAAATQLNTARSTTSSRVNSSSASSSAQSPHVTNNTTNITASTSTSQLAKAHASAEPVFLDHTASGRRLLQKTDKSCVQCRSRREQCEYGEGVTIEVTEDTSQDPKVLALQIKLDAAERKLAQSRESELAEADQSIGPLAVTEDLVQGILGAFEPLDPRERDSVAQKLADVATTTSAIGPSGVDWRLVKPRLAEHLTYHLLDTSACCCCSRLSSFTPLIAHIPSLKPKLTRLNNTEKAIVAVLCALGARSSPHSAILGIEIPGLSNGTADPEVFLTVGIRREKACRSLLNRATDITWYGGLLGDAPSQPSVEVLTGIAQLLIFDEIRPRKSRFFLRNAVGMFSDLQLEMPDDSLLKLQRSCGTALFREDSVHSAQLCTSPLISNNELATYFVNPDLSLPDLANERLARELNELMTTSHESVTLEMLRRSVSIVANWVAYSQRTFAAFAPRRRSSSAEIVNQARLLWTWIDAVQTTCQRLEQWIMSFAGQELPGGHEDDDDPQEINHLVLLAVRSDSRLIDLTNLLHAWLGSEELNSDTMPVPRTQHELQQLADVRRESDCRVRKGLRMTAFFARLYLSSDDKHVCHHLVQQAELLDNWTSIALQAYGDVDGPLAPEYALTSDELDWLVSALRLSLFYTPTAYKRLEQLDLGRRRRSESTQPTFSASHRPPTGMSSKSSAPSTSNSSELLDAFVKHQEMSPRGSGSSSRFLGPPPPAVRNSSSSSLSAASQQSPSGDYTMPMAPPLYMIPQQAQGMYSRSWQEPQQEERQDDPAGQQPRTFSPPQDSYQQYQYEQQQHDQFDPQSHTHQDFASHYAYPPPVEEGDRGGDDSSSMAFVHPSAPRLTQTFVSYAPAPRRPLNQLQAVPPRLAPLSVPWPQPFSFDAHGSPMDSPGYRTNFDAAASAQFGMDSTEVGHGGLDEQEQQQQQQQQERRHRR
ncbi:hypothetical protein ACM66B_003964 [Microbotryomycetes sp. NB124-2]